MKRSFLFINIGDNWLPVAKRIQDEGYEVFCYWDPTTKWKETKSGKGMIDCIVDDLFDVLNQFYDPIKGINKKNQLIIMVDDNGQGDMCTNLQNEGWKVVGSSACADNYEHNREAGNDLAEKMGLTLPPTKTFTDFNTVNIFLDKALEKDPGTKYVFKGDGFDMAGSSKTYMSKSVKDMKRYIVWIENDCQRCGYKLDKFELQEIIPGVEVDYSMYFNSEGYLPTIAVAFEQKKIHGLGKALGCLGQVLYFTDPRQNKYMEYFVNLLPEIKNSNPCQWAVNNIVSVITHEPNFLEFTPRFGWDSTFGELALLQDAGKSIAEFYIMWADGKPFPKDYFPLNRYSATVRLFSESTSAKHGEIKGKPIFWDPSIEENLWFYGICCNDDGDYELTDNAIGVATACGDTPEEAVAKLYAMISPDNDFLTTPDLFYSENIGEGVSQSIKTLQDWGLLPLTSATTQTESTI